jgi:hypothetical protein
VGDVVSRFSWFSWQGLWGLGQEVAGWRVPEFETEGNRDSESTLEWVSFLDWSSRSSTREYNEYNAPLADLVGPVQKNILPTQAAWRVSLPVSLYFVYGVS